MNYLTDKDFYVNLIHTFGDGYIYNLKDVERQDLKKKGKKFVFKYIYGIIVWMDEPIISLNSIKRKIKIIDLTNKNGIIFTVYDSSLFMIGDIIKLTDVSIIREKKEVTFECLNEQNIHVIFTFVYDFENENKANNKNWDERGIFQSLQDKFISQKLEEWISNEIYSNYSLSKLSSRDDPIVLACQVLALQKEGSQFILTIWDGSKPNHSIINPSTSHKYIYFNNDYPLAYKRVVYVQVRSNNYLNLSSFSLKEGDDFYLLVNVKLSSIKSSSKYTLTLDLNQANNCLKHIERCSILGRLLMKRIDRICHVMKNILN